MERAQQQWVRIKTSEEIFRYAWLGKWFLFQTFEELDDIKDKEAEIRKSIGYLTTVTEVAKRGKDNNSNATVWQEVKCHQNTDNILIDLSAG